MKGALLLDVVVRQSATILQLFAGEDQPLLIWGNSFLVLDLGLHILNGVRWFNLQSDSLASEGLDEDLHASSQTENEMKGALLLNVVVRQSATILQLFAGEDEPLLVWWDSFLVLNLGLDILNRIRGLNL